MTTADLLWNCDMYCSKVKFDKKKTMYHLPLSDNALG